MAEAPLKDVAGVDDGIAVGAPPLGIRRPSLRLTRGRLALLAGLVLAAVAAALLAGGQAAKPQHAAVRNAAAPVRHQPSTLPPLRPHPKVVIAVAPGDAPPPAVESAGPTGAAPSVPLQPPSDAEVRSELAAFRQHLSVIGTPRGPKPTVTRAGTAVAPTGVPEVVAAVISAGNAIATTPYKWGGGHGAWRDTGYDCSGSVSFALAGAGLLNGPLVAADFMRFGDPGPGRWITIYANGGHTFMVVAGLRFDTSGAQSGTRWQAAAGRSYTGFAARHPPGY